MVLLLPERENFGKTFGKAIGASLQTAAQGLTERKKQQQLLDLFNQIEGKGTQTPSAGEALKGKMPNPQDVQQKFLQALPVFEQMKGSDLTPQDADAIWANLFEPQLKQSQLGQQPQQMQESAQRQEQDPFIKAKKALLAGQPEMAKLFTEEAKSSQKIKAEERKETFGLAKPTLERGRELLEDLPYKESALTGLKDAIETGNLGMFSLDNLAEMTGIEGFRSPEGAQFKTQSKEFFLGNLSRVGSRGLNQMMEKVVLEMAPLIGRSTEANLAVTEVLGAENDVTRKEAELIHDIGSEYKEKTGHYPEDLAHRVYKELRPYAIQRQKEAIASVDKIKQKYQPKTKEGILMYDPSGNLRRVPYGDKKSALREGYRMP